VSDEIRLGALRFRPVGNAAFHAPARGDVSALLELGRLLQTTERILRDEETDEDLQLIFAPGSSLGGARPKASVVDQHGRLCIAKFPKETDDYSVEAWEEAALCLAQRAGITTREHKLVQIAGKSVLLSRRFDRERADRIMFPMRTADTGVDAAGRGDPEIQGFQWSPARVHASSRCGAMPGNDNVPSDNHGRHVIHTGARHASFLQLPQKAVAAT
jgi:serine/threonine-protein kinase HipA